MSGGFHCRNDQRGNRRGGGSGGNSRGRGGFHHNGSSDYQQRWPMDQHRLYVGNLYDDVQEDEINELFQPYGVTKVALKKEKDRKPFCFVSLPSEEEVSKAMEDLANTNFRGKRLLVSLPRTRNPDRTPCLNSRFASTDSLATVTSTSTSFINGDQSWPDESTINHVNSETQVSNKDSCISSPPPLTPLPGVESKRALLPHPVNAKAVLPEEKHIIMCVVNLPSDITEVQLHELLEDFKPLEIVMGQNVKANGKSFTYAYALVSNEDCSFSMKMELDNTYFHEKLIGVVQLNDITMEDIAENSSLVQNVHLKKNFISKTIINKEQNGYGCPTSPPPLIPL